MRAGRGQIVSVHACSQWGQMPNYFGKSLTVASFTHICIVKGGGGLIEGCVLPG